MRAGVADAGTGTLNETEFIEGISSELKRIRAICAVPDKCTPFQIAFTIPELLLDSPMDRRISGSLHIRMMRASKMYVNPSHAWFKMHDNQVRCPSASGSVLSSPGRGWIGIHGR